MPRSSILVTLQILRCMISQANLPVCTGQLDRKKYHWEVRHAGLQGLRHLVAIRRDLLVCNASQSNGDYEVKTDSKIHSEEDILQDVLAAALIGIRDSDDDVRGTAAGALKPIAKELVEQLPAPSLLDLLAALRASLDDIRDDLSNSAANILDLLSTLIQHQAVLELFSRSGTG